MSSESYYTNLIDSTNERIAKYRQQNDELTQQQEQKKEELKKQSWITYYLKKAYSSARNKMHNYLLENGGIFALNDEQKAKYLQMMEETDSLKSSWTAARGEQYNYAQNVTGLGNSIYSINSRIFDATLDLGDYTNEQALFNHLTQGLG